MVDSAIIKKTQESLAKVIKKPPLTEKLLSKPPFRYLHDIISEVTKNSGYLEGLFGDDEKASANVKEKEQKLAYLQKAIDAVGFSIGQPLSVRANKIIAGQEAEKTNEFLQHLGKCAAKGPDSDAVKRVKKGEKPSKKTESGKTEGKSKRTAKDEERKPKSSKERESSKTRGKREQSSSKERGGAMAGGDSKERKEKSDKRGRREKSSKREDVEPVEDKAGKDAQQKKEKEEQREAEKKAREAQKESDGKRENEEKRKQQKEAEQTETDAPNAQGAAEESLSNGVQAEQESQAATARIPRPSSAKGARRRPDPSEPGEQHKPTYAEAVTGATTGDNAIPITTGVRRERPTSARPAPPKIRKKEEERQADVPLRSEPPAGIITDTAATTEDVDDMYVNEGAEDMPSRQPPVIMGNSGSGSHGGLVQKIMESQKNYTDPVQEKQTTDKAPVMNQAARQKQRALVQKEIDLLRGSIQMLASSAAPLGKVLDYLQEDLDSMQKELETWRSENKYHDTAIKAEQSHMDKTLEPLRDQLDETDREIANMINRINASKCNIHTNDKRIEKMLSTMSFG